MKLEKVIKELFFALMISIWLIIILFIFNSLCGKCIHKDLDKIINLQGYSYDKKHNSFENYTQQEKCDSCEKQNFAKQRFPQNKTTGMMTFIPTEETTSCRSCN